MLNAVFPFTFYWKRSNFFRLLSVLLTVNDKTSDVVDRLLTTLATGRREIFPSPEFGIKSGREVPIFLQLPEFSCNESVE